MEPENREERGSGRSRNVVHTLPRSMGSVPRFLTGPLERVDPAAGTFQLLVLTVDAETAVTVAEAVFRMTGHGGIEVLPVTTGKRAKRLFAERPVAAAAGSPREVRELVRESALKLENVTSVVLAWAEEILEGDAEDLEALEAIMAEVPKDAERIVVTARADGRVNAFAERYLRRARRESDDSPETTEPVEVQYVTVAPASRMANLRRLLDDLDPPSAVIVARSEQAYIDSAATLRLLGYGAGGAVRVTRGEVPPSTYAAIFVEMPESGAELAAAAAAGTVTRVVLVEGRELPALRRMAGGGSAVRPFFLSGPAATARDRDAAVRRELASVVESGLASRELLALEPMLERHDGIEIAAAALKLLERERTLRKNAEAELRARSESPSRPPVEREFDGDRRGEGPPRGRGRDAGSFDKRGEGPPRGRSRDSGSFDRKGGRPSGGGSGGRFGRGDGPRKPGGPRGGGGRGDGPRGPRRDRE